MFQRGVVHRESISSPPYEPVELSERIWHGRKRYTVDRSKVGHVKNVDCVVTRFLPNVLVKNKYSVQVGVGGHLIPALKNTDGQTCGWIDTMETIVRVDEAIGGIIMNSARVPEYCRIV